MAREPSITDDAPEAAPAGQGRGREAGGIAAATSKLVTGAAIGIGSAALVAALLYANRARKADKS